MCGVYALTIVSATLATGAADVEFIDENGGGQGGP